MQLPVRPPSRLRLQRRHLELEHPHPPPVRRRPRGLPDQGPRDRVPLGRRRRAPLLRLPRPRLRQPQRPEQLQLPAAAAAAAARRGVRSEAPLLVPEPHERRQRRRIVDAGEELLRGREVAVADELEGGDESRDGVAIAIAILLLLHRRSPAQSEVRAWRSDSRRRRKWGSIDRVVEEGGDGWGSIFFLVACFLFDQWVSGGSLVLGFATLRPRHSLLAERSDNSRFFIFFG
ncbi:hypothetical protein EUGRSUZ_I00542 [Eucalyptus grandis]|uniref:Uncharacterized protein n=2 Tax=Eucalyptus grandis TaxID=71139 RepID=A0ACC3JCA6_EUCGR|nr:hypothetical protein EUGRSUZ_I00542 [Eucalyptus grandis]